MLNRHKNWLVHKQTACGKDFSNPFMVDNLPKIVGFSTHLASLVKSWLVQDQTVLALASPKANELTIPEQTATGKGTSNPFMAGSLPKTTKPTYLERRWLLEGSLDELEVVVVGDDNMGNSQHDVQLDLSRGREISLENRVIKDWYVVKGAWLEGLINLRVDLSDPQVVPSLEREEVELVLGWCYELLAMQQQHRDQVVEVSEVKVKLSLKVL
ncbi:hypothetical protein Tco_0164622 [Tanacetum coccineum]